MAEKQEPQSVDMAGFEKEFGLEGNVSSAQSSHGDDAAAADVSGGEESGDEQLERIATTNQDGEIDTKTISDYVSREEAIKDLDDNLAIMDADLEREKAAAAAEDDDADDEPEEDETDGEDEQEEEGAAAADEGEEGEEAEGAEGGSGDEAADPGDGSADEGADEADPYEAWLERNLSDEEDQSALLDAMLKRGAKLTFKSNGELVTMPLSDVVNRAAGYAGQAAVTRQMQQVAAKEKDLTEREEQVQKLVQDTDAQIKALTESIEDVEGFSSFLTERASLDYLRTMRDRLDATIEQAESDPTGFTTSRRISSLEGKIDMLLNGGRGQDPAPDSQGGGKPDTKQPTKSGGPTEVPENFGFVRGQGYPEQLTRLAWQDAEAVLDGAKAIGQTGVTMKDAVEAWKAGGKQETLRAVTVRLLGSRSRDSRKREISDAPPVRKASKGGRARSGGKRPSEAAPERRRKAVAWDDIPAQVERQLKASQAGAELSS